jgi:C4-dicarboxylate transporter, DctQ subunit
VRLAWLERLEEWLIALLLAAMTTVTFSQVIARYVFNYSFTWALELTSVLFAWMIFLGIPYGVRVGSHIGVDSFVKALGAKAGRVVGAIAAALGIVYSGILLVGSWNYVAKIHEVGIMMDDLPIEQWLPRTILIFCFGLLALRFGQVLYRILAGREVRLHLGDEAAEALKQQAEFERTGGSERP